MINLIIKILKDRDGKLRKNSENIVEIKLDSKERAYATGKRKNSIARVWLKRGGWQNIN